MSNLKSNLWFFNLWASTYDFSPFQYLMKSFHAPVLKEISKNPKGKLLDISCGTGQLLKTINEIYPHLDIQGLDYSPKMLKQSRKRLSEKIHLMQGDVHKLPYSDQTFDYVISTEAFHHYHNQKLALKEMYRITKTNGKIIIVDINFIFKPINLLFAIIEPGCKKINSKKEFLTMFKELKLKEIKQKRSNIFTISTTGKRQI